MEANGASTPPASSVPLPKARERNVLVTSALPYVNNYPHLGNIIGAVLSADVYARYLRQRGTNVLYVCGTDEYGTATETKAQQEGLTPRQICDKYHALHKEVYEWFDIHFDVFGRTSTPAQTEIVQSVFWDVHKRGYIAEDTTEQLFCVSCSRFLADRYVNGTCPSCGYDDARGDQCDNCGRMLNPSELLTPRCATCSSTPIVKSTGHLFLDLPKVTNQLEEWVAETAERGQWTDNARAMTDTWLRDGLKKRSITRDLKWGVPVPLQGYQEKVFYVWFDAPIGYLSITKSACGEQWRNWWQPKETEGCEDVDVELVQFMGKDNVPFHTIVFPSSLLASGKKWTMLHHLSTSEYLQYEGGKFSKSRGIGVFGNDAKETGIPVEVWRYYLLLNRPESSDSAFTWSDLAAKNNDELIKTLGNFINRAVTFLWKSFDGVVPDISNDPDDQQYIDSVNKELAAYIEVMNKVSLKAGLKKAMAIASIGNLYLQRKQPWKLLKEGRKEEAGASLTFAANLAVLVTIALEPFLGTRFSEKVFDQLGIVHQPGVNNIIPDKFEVPKWVVPGQRTKANQILFTALKPDRIAELRSKYSGAAEANGKQKEDEGEAWPLDLRVANVVECEPHAESERLFVAKVDVGEEKPRTLVAGLRDVYTKEELLGRKVVCVCNLAPATLAGIESQAMILCGEKKKVMETLGVPENATVGDIILPEGLDAQQSDTPLNRRGFQNASKLLRIGKEGNVLFNKQRKLVLKSDSSLAVKVQNVPEGGKVK